MNPRLKYWLRWIAILPGALLAAILATVVLHLILYITLTKFVTPYPELPERILTPFVISAIFIWAGNEIAPNYKNTTAIILFGLWLFLAGGFIFLTLTDSSWFGKKLYFQAGGIAPIMAIVGALFGVYKARKSNNDKD